MVSYKTNRSFRDPIYQNKGSKRIESFRSSNRRRKLDRGFNHNIYLEEDEEASKNAEIEPESDLDLELESFIYVIKNFDLDNNKSNCSIGSLNFRNSVEDSKI